MKDGKGGRPRVELAAEEAREGGTCATRVDQRMQRMFRRPPPRRTDGIDATASPSTVDSRHRARAGDGERGTSSSTVDQRMERMGRIVMMRMAASREATVLLLPLS